MIFCQKEPDVRIEDHPILGKDERKKRVTITFDGKQIEAYEGEMIASALVAAGAKTLRFTSKKEEPRGLFCAIGRCTDCVMEVNGRANVRTCVTPVQENMEIKTQSGLGVWHGSYGL
jgi:predicted molibdopterin-dependent oxidoreductase YjgC